MPMRKNRCRHYFAPSELEDSMALAVMVSNVSFFIMYSKITTSGIRLAFTCDSSGSNDKLCCFLGEHLKEKGIKSWNAKKSRGSGAMGTSSTILYKSSFHGFQGSRTSYPSADRR